MTAINNPYGPGASPKTTPKIMENENGYEETLNPQGDEDTNPQEDPQEKPQEEEKDYKSLYENQKIRAEKVEKELKGFKSKEEVKEEVKTEGLSQRDFLTIAKADVHEDDLDDVLDYAKFKKIDVKEALASGVIKSLLAERKETRRTAEATSTGSKRSGVKGKDGTELLRDAESGQLPESDDDIEALVEARFQSKANKTGGR